MWIAPKRLFIVWLCIGSFPNRYAQTNIALFDFFLWKILDGWADFVYEWTQDLIDSVRFYREKGWPNIVTYFCRKLAATATLCIYMFCIFPVNAIHYSVNVNIIIIGFFEDMYVTDENAQKCYVVKYLNCKLIVLKILTKKRLQK